MGNERTSSLSIVCYRIMFNHGGVAVRFKCQNGQISLFLKIFCNLPLFLKYVGIYY